MRSIKDQQCAGIIIIWCMALAIGIVLAGYAFGDEIPKEVLCVIGEAEGEGYNGMLAVSEAIRNRGTLKGVYGCNAKRVTGRLYSDETLRIASQAWKDSRGFSDITHGATHWEGTAFPVPYWAEGMIVTATIGRQRFYK